MVVAEIPDREALGNCEPWLFSPISCPLNRTGINLTREPPSRTASRGDSQSRTILGTAGVLMLLPGWPVLVNRRSVTSDVTEAPTGRASSGSSLATG